MARNENIASCENTQLPEFTPSGQPIVRISLKSLRSNMEKSFGPILRSNVPRNINRSTIVASNRLVTVEIATPVSPN
ncbi:hypothetical protein D3C80_1218160 [compost metagenome]